MSDREAGGYLLAEALGRADQEMNMTLVTKTDATTIAQDIYLSIVKYWEGILQADAKDKSKNASEKFQADSNSANAAQAPANTLVQTEEGVAAQVPQNMANLLHSCTDIIGLFSFVAQLQSSQA